MNYLEVIDRRISRRTYVANPITIEKVEKLKDEISKINKESGLTAIYIKDASSAFDSVKKSYGLFKGVRSLIVLKGPKKDAFLKEKAGYFGERLVLEATTLDLGTCWVAGTYDHKNTMFQVGDEEEILSVITIGNVPDNQTFKEKMVYNIIRRKSKKVDELYESDNQVSDWFLAGIKAVQKAPSAINSQKVKFQYKNGKISASVPETYPTDLVDLGIAKLHFELATNGKFELGNGAVFIKE